MAEARKIVPAFVTDSAAPFRLASPPNVTYHGGPLLRNAEVFTIFWGGAWTNPPTSSLVSPVNQFFDFILTSSLIDVLAEYNAPNFRIGHGRRTGTLTITSSEPGSEATSAAPATCVFQNQIFAFWKANDPSNRIFVAQSGNGQAWSGGQPINGTDSTSSSVAACVFQNQIFVFWKSDDSSNRIFVSQSADGQTWSGGQPINGTDSTSDSVAACVFQNQIFLFWKANDPSNRILVSQSSSGTGASFQAGQAINGGDSTSAGPAACVSGNQLLLFWKSNDPSNRIFVSQSSSGAGGSFPAGQAINGGDSTSAAPAVCVFDDQSLSLFWKANDPSNRIFVSSSFTGRPGTWLDAQVINDFDSTSAALGAAIFGANIFLLWKANDPSNQIFFSQGLDNSFLPGRVIPIGGIQDNQIQEALQGWIGSQTIPRPNANTLYFVYLPPGVQSFLKNFISCIPPGPNSMCGYHNGIPGVLGSPGIQYAVVAFPCPVCTCQASSLVDSLTVTSSHELCEAITDPDPNNAGWYDENSGNEIGDNCPACQNLARLGGFQVQGMWSNATGGCITNPGRWQVGNVTNTADSTSAGPAACVFLNDQLFAFWKANDRSNRIFVAQSADGRTWSRGQPINGTDSTSDSVAACVFLNQIFVFWKANDSSNRIFVSQSPNGLPNSFQTGQAINGVDSTSAGPAACVYGDLLSVFWKSKDPSNRIFFSQSPNGAGNSFQTGKAINGIDSTSAAPAVCVLTLGLDQLLYVFWKANDAPNSIYFSASGNGFNWPPGQAINSGDSTSAGPAACVFGDNQLFVFWKANDPSNRIFFSQSSTSAIGLPNGFPAGQVINNIDTTSAAPAAAVFHGQIFLLWKSNDPSNRIFVSVGQ